MLLKRINSSLLFTIIITLWCCHDSKSPEQLPQTSNELAAIKKLVQEAEAIALSAPEVSLKLLDSILTFPSIYNYPDLLNEIDYIHCTVEISTGLKSDAYESCLKVYHNSDEIIPAQKRGVVSNQLGIYFDIFGQPDSAVYFFQQAEQLFLAAKDTNWLGELYNNWGVLYSGDLDQSNAINLYSKGLQYAEWSENLAATILSNINLGRAYFRQGFYLKAEEHFQKVDTLANRPEHRFWSAVAAAFIGDIYLEQSNLSRARDFYERGYQIALQDQNTYALIKNMTRLGQLELASEKCDLAIEWLLKAKAQAQKINKKKDLVYIQNALIEAYLKVGSMDYAQNEINGTAKLIESAQVTHENYLKYKQVLADFYLHKQAYLSAYSELYNYIKIKESAFDHRSARLIYELESSYKTKEQADRILALQERNSNQEDWIWLISILGFILMILLFISLRLYNANKKLNANLETKIKERTSELEKSNYDLQQFAYVASHDLKTPLRSIASFLTLIERKITQKDDKQLHELLNYATNGAKQMNHLINDLLEYSKLNHGDNQDVLVDLNTVFLDCKKHLEDYITRRGAIVQAVKLPVIEGNYRQISQLFQNLIINSIKYNESEIPMVTIRMYELEEANKFVFEDNGIGIENKYQSVIFEMFRRLHSDAAYEGTGIGLALCKKIVGIHGGTIWADSIPGKGSKFSFTIPKVNHHSPVVPVHKPQPLQKHFHQ